MTVTNGAFNMLATIPEALIKMSSLWLDYQNNGSVLHYNVEAQISSYIERALKEIVHIYGLSINICPCLRGNDYIPDIWILTLHDVPLAVIEVKKPLVTNTGAPHTTRFASASYGQLSVYMIMLRKRYGIIAPIGILTTYTSWEFCWLDNSNDVALATDLDSIRNITSFTEPGTTYVSTSILSFIHQY